MINPDQKFTPERTRELKAHYGRQLAEQTAAAFDSFASQIIGGLINRLKQVNDPELASKLTAYEDADDAITAYLESNNFTVLVGPRKVRHSDRIIPGQHGGILIQLQDQDTGFVLRINAHGGMRDSHDATDMRDGRYAYIHNNIHADKTIDIRSLKRHINLQMAASPQDEAFLDIWMTVDDEQIRLSTFTFNGINQLSPTLFTSADKRYREVVPKLQEAMSTLVSLVPNPFSPRA